MKLCAKTHFFLLLCCSTASSLFAEVGYVEPWGRDDFLIRKQPSSIPPVPEDSSFSTRIAEKIILFHQEIISPCDGPRSHFRPTSSRYMLLSMKRHGFIQGFLMGCDRLMRENSDPWVYKKVSIDGVSYKYDPTFN